MYIDRIWPFTTFISRNKHKKNIRLRLYWLRLRCKLLIPLPPPPPHHFGKLQIWDDQSLLQNTPLPPISENFRFGMTKVYSGIPPHFGKLQIWDDQSLLWNTPPISENFRFGMTKVYSGIPPPPPLKIVRESKSESFRMPRVTTCGDFIQPG